MDISAAAAERIRSRLGLPCLAGTLPHPELAPESFDVVTMWASLEHVHQPLEVLREAYRLLAPGGKLLASVPNIESAAFRWFGPAWFPLELPRHLTHFSPKTFDKMFRRAGFRTEPVRMFSRSNWLRNSAQLARQQGRGPRRLQWLAFRPMARLVAAWCVLTRQAEDLLITGIKPG
jgi:SAM-dependent methyltransferase